jgi:hypothetical protein
MKWNGSDFLETSKNTRGGTPRLDLSGSSKINDASTFTKSVICNGG